MDITTVFKTFTRYAEFVINGGDFATGKVNTNSTQFLWVWPTAYQPKEFFDFAVAGFDRSYDGGTPSSDPDKARRTSDAVAFSKLMNSIPSDLSNVVDREKAIGGGASGSNDLSSIYGRLVSTDASRPMALPIPKDGKSWDAKQKKSIEKLIKQLSTKKLNENLDALRSSYRKALNEYATLRGAYDAGDQSAQQLYPQIASDLLNQITQARTAFEAANNTLQQAYAQLSLLPGGDLSSFVATLKTRFDRDSSPNGNGWITPAPTSFADAPQNWSRIYFDAAKSSNYSQLDTNTWDGSAGYNALVWGVSVESQGKIVSRQTSGNYSDLRIGFGVTSVRLVRPWFDPIVLESRWWKWKPNLGVDGDLSDGNIPPSGRLPGYAVEAIYAHDITFESSELAKSAQDYEREIAAGGKVNIGSFQLGATYKNSAVQSKSEFQKTSGGFIAKGIHLIGLRYKLVGKLPNPITLESGYVWA